jgi:hypothetical protein
VWRVEDFVPVRREEAADDAGKGRMKMKDSSWVPPELAIDGGAGAKHRAGSAKRAITPPRDFDNPNARVEDTL